VQDEEEIKMSRQGADSAGSSTSEGSKENQGPGSMNHDGLPPPFEGKNRQELEAELKWIKQSIRDRIQVS